MQLSPILPASQRVITYFGQDKAEREKPQPQAQPTQRPLSGDIKPSTQPSR